MSLETEPAITGMRDRLGDGRPQAQLLVVGEGGRLARGAGHDQGVVAVVLEVAGQRLRTVEIERASRRRTA